MSVANMEKCLLSVLIVVKKISESRKYMSFPLGQTDVPQLN